jgi:hypothetical protein
MADGDIVVGGCKVEEGQPPAVPDVGGHRAHSALHPTTLPPTCTTKPPIAKVRASTACITPAVRSAHSAKMSYARIGVVTGANKGIGYAIGE